jgi:hypothetical protein
LVWREEVFLLEEQRGEIGAKGTYIRDAQIIIHDRGRTQALGGVEVLDLFFFGYVDMDVMYINPNLLQTNVLLL